MAGLDIHLSVQPLNENSLLLSFGATKLQPNPQLAVCLGGCRQVLLSHFGDLVLDCVPSYTSLLIYYDVLALARAKLSLEAWCGKVLDVLNQHLLQTPNNARALEPQNEAKLIEIPVCYGEQEGPDLARLARDKNLSCDEIIRLHCSVIYTVYALGFKPGFAYLGFVDDKISAPRLATPRQKVPAGSVGIADKQSGVYPCDSPGGWNIIGRSPVQVFDQGAQPEKSMCLFSVGARVKFVAISRQEFDERCHE